MIRRQPRQEIKAELRLRMHQTIPDQGHWLKRPARSTESWVSILDQGSLLTRRWSKGDSNSLSHRERSGHGRAPHTNHRTIARERSLSIRRLSSTARGTGSSNPLCSSGESGANRNWPAGTFRSSAEAGPGAIPHKGDRGFESTFLQRRVRCELASAAPARLFITAAAG